MKRFGIAAVEKLSGVKAHSLRTWEHRYGIPVSSRDGHGVRSYSLAETRRILLMALLNRYGFKISLLVTLDAAEIIQKLHNLHDEDCLLQLAVHDLLFSMYAMDRDGFEQQLEQCFLKWSDHTVVTRIIHFFLRDASLLWQGSRLAEEHLVVPVLRKKMFSCLEGVVLGDLSTKTALLFLSDTRQLDLTLLQAFYLLQHAGLHVIYLGTDVSLDNLSVLFETQQPDFLYTYLPAKNKFPFQKLSELMTEKLPGGKLVVTLQSEAESDDAVFDNRVITSFKKAMDLMMEA